MSIETSTKTALTPSKKTQNFLGFNTRSPGSGGDNVGSGQLMKVNSPKLNEKKNPTQIQPRFGLDEKKIVARTINLALNDEFKPVSLVIHYLLIHMKHKKQ